MIYLYSLYTPGRARKKSVKNTLPILGNSRRPATEHPPTWWLQCEQFAEIKKGVFKWPGFDGKLGTTWNYILGVLFFQIETAAGTLHKSLARVQCIDGNEANLETLILLLKQNHVQKVFWTATPHCSRVNPHGGYGWRWSRHLYKFWWIFNVYPEILSLSSLPLWKKSPFCSTPSTSSFDTSKYHSVHNYTHYIPPSCLLTQVWYC